MKRFRGSIQHFRRKRNARLEDSFASFAAFICELCELEFWTIGSEVEPFTAKYAKDSARVARTAN